MESADEIFRIVAEADMPPGRNAVLLEICGQPRWLIREGHATPALIDDLNQLATHLVRHGLWVPQRDGEKPPPPRMRQAG